MRVLLIPRRWPILGRVKIEGALYLTQTHNMQSIHLRFHPSAHPLYHGLQLGMCNSLSKIGQPIVYNLTTIFAAPHHNLCCTSPQYLLHLTTIFAAPHYKSTETQHDLCYTLPQSLQHLTTIFAAPHHRSSASHHKLHCNHKLKPDL